MSDKKATIIIEAEDRASKALGKIADSSRDLKDNLLKLGAGMAAIGAASTVAAKSFVDASVKMENSLIGLNTVSRAFGANSDDAKEAAKSLARDGLMSVSDAASGLKNLLATGFSLPEAIKLMNGFKDSAAFNRQGSLAFGQAIVGATEGLKNQNSILVDNAGVTKNLSVILTEAGMSQSDLSKITTDATVRQALYNGLIKETSIFQGDAMRAGDTLGGSMARLNTQMFEIKATIGDALAPAVLSLIEAITPLLTKFSEFATKNPELIATLVAVGIVIGIVGSAMLTLVAISTVLSAALGVLTVIIGILTSPIFLVIVAIGLMVAAIVYLIKHWDLLKANVVEVWNQIKKTIVEAMDYLVGKIKAKMSDAWSSVEGFGNKIIGVFTRIKDAIYSAVNAASNFSSGITGNISSKLGFQHGGIVPGGAGDAVPALLHGGERVVSRTGSDVNTQGSSSGTTVNLIIEGDVNSMDMVQSIVDAVKGALGRDSELAQLGVSI